MLYTSSGASDAVCTTPGEAVVACSGTLTAGGTQYSSTTCGRRFTSSTLGEGAEAWGTESPAVLNGRRVCFAHETR